MSWPSSLHTLNAPAQYLFQLLLSTLNFAPAIQAPRSVLRAPVRVRSSCLGWRSASSRHNALFIAKEVIWQPRQTTQPNLPASPKQMPFGGMNLSGPWYPDVFLMYTGLIVLILPSPGPPTLFTFAPNLFLPLCVPFLTSLRSLSVQGIVRPDLSTDTRKHSHSPY